MQQNHPAPISAGDGAIVGLMAGAIGAVVGIAACRFRSRWRWGRFRRRFSSACSRARDDMPPKRAASSSRCAAAWWAVRSASWLHLQPRLQPLRLLGLRAVRRPDRRGDVQEERAAPPPPPPTRASTPPTFTPPSSFSPPAATAGRLTAPDLAIGNGYRPDLQAAEEGPISRGDDRRLRVLLRSRRAPVQPHAGPNISSRAAPTAARSRP